jgi:hypothetical protein
VPHQLTDAQLTLRPARRLFAMRWFLAAHCVFFKEIARSRRRT